MSNQNAATTIEKFVSTHLSRIAVEPFSPRRRAGDERLYVSPPAAPPSRRKSFRILGRAAVVFVCGMAVGYLLSYEPEVSRLKSKGPHGAAGLRIDYDLRER